MTDIAVVIVNYNTRDLLRQCVRSVEAACPSAIVVVDNASTDGSDEMIREEFLSLKLLRNDMNVGYGAASNRAIASCTDPYILLMNSDALLLPETLHELSSYLDQYPRAAIVGPRLERADQKLQPSCFPYPTPLDILMDTSHLSQLARFIPVVKDRYLRTWNHSHSRQVPWVVGAAMAIRKRAFHSVGGFDESYFMYYEEVDLCYRLAQNGWQIHYTPSARVIHAGGASTIQQRADMIVQFHASLAHFYRRHYSTLRFAQLLLLVRCITLARLARDTVSFSISQNRGRKDRLAIDIAAWRRLISGDWDFRRVPNQRYDG